MNLKEYLLKIKSGLKPAVENLKSRLKGFRSSEGAKKLLSKEGAKKLLSKKVFFPLIAGLFALVFLGSFIRDHITCVGGLPVYRKTKKAVEEKPEERPPIPIKVYKVAKVSFRDTLTSLGSIKGFREIDLKFPVAGTIEYLNFKEGERITQGDIIANLDQKEALLKLEYARVELDKNTKLFELGSIVETKLKQSQLEYQSAKAELDKTNLIAPSDGYIGSVEVDRGSYVTPQDKMAMFVDIKDVYIEFGIIEKDVSKIKEGQNVEIVVESYPDQIFKGQVESISPLVEGRSRTVQVKSKISNVDEKIKPGMFGRVNVLIYEKDEALVVPSSAFKKKEDQYLVYVVHPEEKKEEASAEEAQEKKEKKAKKGRKKREKRQKLEEIEEPSALYGTVEIRPIEINYATPDALEVKEGIEEGELVMLDVEQDVPDKSRVEISETQEGIF
ncbi:MAG: efflux RND transporter periplasmic adaptor subunit [Candidatus Omnitrophica bacterium]|nr:efflux RND transporter periplasmic adaptor subunit [Candidatus Omnitrophota bacterium]